MPGIVSLKVLAFWKNGVRKARNGTSYVKNCLVWGCYQGQFLRFPTISNGNYKDICSFIKLFLLFFSFGYSFSLGYLSEPITCYLYWLVTLVSLGLENVRSWQEMNHRFLGFERRSTFIIFIYCKFLKTFTKIIMPELGNEVGLNIKNLATVRIKLALRSVFPVLGFLC